MILVRFVRESLSPLLKDEERMAEIPVRYKRQVKMERKKAIMLANKDR